ncbi:MAG: accessory gene regulator B family protein [Bacilli bacterium]
MKEKIVNSCISLIKNNNPKYSSTKLAEIKYGLEGIYLLITKLVVIGILAYFLNLFAELLIFLLIYNFIRMPSFGLHATKSWICLLSSIIIFIGVPIFCKEIIMPSFIKAILGIITIVLFYKNAPADTYKRPIVNPKRRLCYKYLSVLVAIIYSFCALFITNNFIANTFISALIVQCFMISPTIYKLFNLPYDNYKTYLAKKAI